MLIAAIILLTALAVWAFWYGLAVRAYTVYSDKLAAPVRAVLVTDLHSYTHGSDQSPMLERIRAAEPDVIFLAGDIVDDRAAPRRGAELFLAGIAGIAPVYYVTGNHERASRNCAEILEFIASYGINILSDEYARIEINGNAIIVAGMEDPVRGISALTQDQTMRRVFGELEGDAAYKILLAHRPERIDIYRGYDFDLVLSGHAHGGQVRIPLILNGLYAPHQGLFPDYAGGMYAHGSLSHIVSRGLSVYFFPPRVFNPPEVVVIDLMPSAE